MENEAFEKIKKGLTKLDISSDRIKSINFTYKRVMERVCPVMKIKLYKIK